MATSDGYAGGSARLSGRNTIYQLLSAAGLSWMIYFHDLPQSLSLVQLWQDQYRQRFQFMNRFFGDVQAGTLPTYSFIEPRYFDVNAPGLRANDQHPPHDVRFGEQLIADVYNALRNAPTWNETLLVILYDEHGGMYDHEAPGPTVNPDGKIGADDLGDHWVTFPFERLGVRWSVPVTAPPSTRTARGGPSGFRRARRERHRDSEESRGDAHGRRSVRQLHRH